MKTATFARSLVYTALAFALALPACGGSSGGSCGKIEPCGGNIVGNWKLTTACVNSAAISSQFTSVCSTASVSSASVTASGTLTFNADMTYAVNANEGGSFTINIPASCLNGASCALLSTAVQSPMFQSATCTGTTSCSCSFVLAPVTTNESGMYTTAGTAAMLHPTSDPTVDNGGDYCVQGKELHLLTVDRTMNMGPMGQATINEDIVAQLQ